MKELDWTDRDNGYNALLNSLGYEILLSVSDPDHVYNGWSRVLFRDGSVRYGVAFFGGDCTSCKFIGRCRTKEQAEKYQQHIERAIHWEYTAGNLAAYLEKGFFPQKAMHTLDGPEFMHAAYATLMAMETA